MRSGAVTSCVLLAAVFAACGGNPDLGTREPSEPGGGSSSGGKGDGGSGATPVLDGTGGSTTDAGGTANQGEVKRLESLRIDPENAVLEVVAGQIEEQAFRVFGTYEGSKREEDITDRTVFYIPDNYLLGAFADSKNVFATAAAPARGGVATVRALAGNPKGAATKADTTITVKLRAPLLDPRPPADGEDAVPDDAADIFDDGADRPDEALAPQLVYPNDGVILPPNLRRLDVHFRPAADTSLYRVNFKSDVLELDYYLRCGAPVAGGCRFVLDEDGYGYLANSSRDSSVELTISGTDDAGTAVGTSETFTINFAKTEVNGGIYYWRTNPEPTAIMRFDFGGVADEPELFLTNNVDYGGKKMGTCVGCHSVSRDGTKLIASLGGQNDGRLVFVDDLSTQNSDPDFLDKAGDGDNRIQFASWNPDGSRFVAVYGDTNADPYPVGNPNTPKLVRHTLWMYDGATGTRLPDESTVFDFEPDHPDWSPDGSLIAFSRVGAHNTSQRPRNCGIWLVDYANQAFGEPREVVPIAPGLNRYNPNFLPGSELLVFSESTCPSGNTASDQCDADDDPTATTWAVEPQSGAKPVWLERASSPGIEDGANRTLHDTFARNSPFEAEFQGKKLYWVTISSRRREGLLNADARQQLWMYAVDPEKLLAGKDGSQPAFFLPLQALGANNHIAQWTQKVISDEPPVVPEPPPPPPPPPVPPSPDPN